MKFGLTTKITLILLLIMLFYTVTLLVYYRFALVNHIAEDLHGIREHFISQGDVYTKEIEQLAPERERLIAYLQRTAVQQQTTFTISDLEGREIVHVGETKPGIWTLRSKTVAYENGKAAYIVDIQTPLKLGELLVHTNSALRLLYVAVCSIGFALLLLMIYLHYDVVRPLLSLHKAMEKVNFRNFKVSLGYKRKDQIGYLFRKFEEMGLRLESAKQDQVEMVSAISHDIKTPLTSILGYMQRLSGGKIKTDEKREEYYEIVYRKAKDLEKLIEDFSSYAKSEAETFRLRTEAVPVRIFFEDLIAEYSEELQTWDAKLTSSLQASPSAMFIIDVRQIRRVFTNLISNALRYGEPPIHVDMRCEIKSGNVVFTVKDNGPGVPFDELKAIFKKFYRTEKSRSREKGGSGLGLSICREIIEAHNGSIHASSSELGGLSVEFTLPLQT